MKKIFLLLFLLSLNKIIFAQKKTDPPNIIIITTDGFRWQELFAGMDTAIANNNKFNEGDSALLYKKYWNENIEERRKLIWPFLWTFINKNGQIYGNRANGNNANVANPYWFSYPGYSEIFCGFVDDSINTNAYKNNPNTTLLDFFQKQPAYKNKIAAFGAWNAFDRILNEPRAGFPVFNAFDPYINSKSTKADLINKINSEVYKPYGEDECLDVITHNMALDYLQTQQPKVLYISYGETDEWAHEGKYFSYLNSAKQVDTYISEIWSYIQNNDFYKNNTVLFITTDHGRGDVVKKEWTSHGSDIVGASEIWFAILGKSIKPIGEIKTRQQFFQKQFAATIAALLNLQFKSEHKLADAIQLN